MLSCKNKARGQKIFVFCVLGTVALTGATVSFAQSVTPDAANQQALEAWNTQSGTNATLKHTELGTAIEWHGDVSADLSQQEASGGQLLTPYRSGTRAQGVLGMTISRTSADSDKTQAVGNFTFTNDRSVTSKPMKINTLQFGTAGKSYELALGDVNASYSQLGTNLGMRGLSGTLKVDALSISATAGVLSESWETLVAGLARQTYDKNIFAVKAALQVGAGATAFVTVQRFADTRGPDADNTQIARSRGDIATAGFQVHKGPVVIEAEVGRNRYEVDGYAAVLDKAALFNASWQMDNLTLRSGYSRVGAYYASLAGTAAPGQSETYLNAAWMPKPWLSLEGDARHFRNETASVGAAQTGDAYTLTVSPTLNEWITGLSAQLQASRSLGKNPDGTENNIARYISSLAYAAAQWSASTGYQELRTDNEAAPESDSVTRTYTVALMRSFQPFGAVSVWNGSIGPTLSYQRQALVGGLLNRVAKLGINLTASRERWGTLTINLDGDVTSRTDGAPKIKTFGYKILAAHPLGKQSEMRLHAGNQQVSGRDPVIYRERNVGLQWAYQF